MTDVTPCRALKTLQYKTMMKPGFSTTTTTNLENLDQLLETERNVNMNEPWCKLNKTVRAKKLSEYVDTYKTTHHLNEEEADTLLAFVRDCLDKKKLQRVKDVTYDRQTGVIKDIPALCYIKQAKRFTLKTTDKKVSSLKSLPPRGALATNVGIAAAAAAAIVASSTHFTQSEESNVDNDNDNDEDEDV